jgi:hypothetical protein
LSNAQLWLRHFAYFSRRLSNSTLEAMTARGATINTDFAACSVDLPTEYTFTRASGGGYVDSLGRLQGQYPAITAPIVPQTTREERVKNGGFDSDSLWTKGTGWTIGSGVASKSVGAGDSIYQNASLIPGQTFRLRYEITSISANSVIPVLDGVGFGTARTATGLYEETFVAAAATQTIGFYAPGACSIDNVSVTLDQGLKIPVGAGQDVKVGQLLRIEPQDATANTYMLGKVVAYDGAIATIDVVEAAAPELISNGHFTSGTTGWTAAGSASLAVSSGQLEVTRTVDSNDAATQAVSVTAGATYLLQLDTGTGTQSPAYFATDFTSIFPGSNARSSTQFTASVSTATISLWVAGGNGTALFDNISVKRAHTAWIVSLAGPRLTHDSDGTALGLLVEPTATNLLLNSTTLSTQNVTTSAVAYTLSFYGTGTVTLSGTSTAGPLVGTGADDRVSLTFTPSAGTLTLTVSGTVENAQLETGSVATSWVWTGSVSRSRSADVCTIEGDDFTARVRQDAGTMLCRLPLQRWLGCLHAAISATIESMATTGTDSLSLAAHNARRRHSRPAVVNQAAWINAQCCGRHGIYGALA